MPEVDSCPIYVSVTSENYNIKTCLVCWLIVVYIVYNVDNDIFVLITFIIFTLKGLSLFLFTFLFLKLLTLEIAISSHDSSFPLIWCGYLCFIFTSDLFKVISIKLNNNISNL